jgi:hypothetical protein
MAPHNRKPSRDECRGWAKGVIPSVLLGRNDARGVDGYRGNAPAPSRASSSGLPSCARNGNAPGRAVNFLTFRAEPAAGRDAARPFRARQYMC